jgi:hypothetical protein
MGISRVATAGTIALAGMGCASPQYGHFIDCVPASKWSFAPQFWQGNA